MLWDSSLLHCVCQGQFIIVSTISRNGIANQASRLPMLWRSPGEKDVLKCSRWCKEEKWKGGGTRQATFDRQGERREVSDLNLELPRIVWLRRF